MSIKRSLNKSKFVRKFFEDVNPIKLTEARRVKLHTENWGVLTEYYLESVKITSMKTGELYSCATLKIGDRSGQVVCIVRGPQVGLLFGMSPEEWNEIEKLCENRQQLFYRYFKDGLSNNFGFRQKLFYYFCKSNQKTDALIAIFKRCMNMRNKDKSDAFLDIIELRKCDDSLLDLYISYLRRSAEELPVS